MSLKEDFEIRLLDYTTAMSMVVQKHYLHRKAHVQFAFGLFKKNDGMPLGVITYGKPANHALCSGICGEEESEHVIELTRLWIREGTPKNSESFLIGNTLPLIDNEIVVSYAEPQYGHVGVIYQTTNWLYTGLSERHCKWVIDGKDVHSRHIMDLYGNTENAIKMLGDRIQKVERPRKHRYVYFNCDRRRKRALLKKLRYPILPYPKGTSEIARTSDDTKWLQQKYLF